ncbi:MAG: aminotransferase class V-fold PLP-dependent enzyme [Gemmatimonadetes bacterium]|jgi:selenocysteine lyase/cysteine desulfurase|nr:aminotransferase class V-fold PLP-dependent enzyme [Gemmatimonadota bacterium]MBT6144173.1 aminotransferase class V-fold PLP-dependent enzyme [Gemmatimonadota bacterium]MBT7861703.1 aminotransferase class V-fold PLP-dependent enzyme [Gemmatimonadota bacterium]
MSAATSAGNGIDLAAIRAQFPALANYVWFQNGGVSITPEPVAREHIRLMEELLVRGPMHMVYPDEEYPRRRRSMERISRFFDVPAEEMALMRGVSEGFQTILRGMSWQEGDRIVISADEEAALLLPCLHLRDLHGVEVVKVPLAESPEEALASTIAAMDGGRTRLLALSHVTTDLGYRFPVEAQCAAARERGVPSFLDLAHSCGVVPYRLRDLGCDYAGLLSYKWMMSPYAAGALWIRQEMLDSITPTYAGGRGEKWLDFTKDEYELYDSAERFQYGPWSWPLVHAWAFACDWLTEIGPERIWSRVTQLTTRLKEGLAQIDGVEVYTPAAIGASAGLVSFGMEGWTGEALAAALRERWNMVIKPLPHSHEGLRASLPFYVLDEEVDLLLTALRTLRSE